MKIYRILIIHSGGEKNGKQSTKSKASTIDQSTVPKVGFCRALPGKKGFYCSFLHSTSIDGGPSICLVLRIQQSTKQIFFLPSAASSGSRGNRVCIGYDWATYLPAVKGAHGQRLRMCRSKLHPSRRAGSVR